MLEFYKKDFSYFGIYELRSKFGEPIFDAERAVRFINEVICESLSQKYRDKLSQMDRDLSDIEKSDYDPSTKKRLTNARLGQGAYRKELDRIWGKRCAVSGCETRAVLRASHIKPWSECELAEKLDANNGILLAAHYDALFDKKLITFKNSGAMRVSTSIGKEERLRLGLPKSLPKPFDKKQRPYLKHHRSAFR